MKARIYPHAFTVIVGMVFLGSGVLASEKLTASERLSDQAADALTSQKTEDAILLYTKALAADPIPGDKWRLLLGRAIAYSKKGDLGASLSDLDEAISLNPPALPLAKMHVMRGGLYAIMCKPEMAAADTERAVNLDQSNPETVRARATVRLYYAGMYESAMEDFEQSLQLARATESGERTNQTSITLCKRGEARLDLGEYADALADFQTAARLRPSGEAYAGLALASVEMGQYLEAKAYAEHALALNSGEKGALRALGLIALCAGDFETAAKDFDRCGYDLGLAIVTVEQGNPESALALLDRKVAPSQCDSRRVSMVRGELLYLLGRTAEAHLALSDAFKSDCIPSLSWSLLCLSSQDTNEESRIAEELQKKLAAFPDAFWLKRLIFFALGRKSLDATLSSDQTTTRNLKAQHRGDAFYIAGEREFREKRYDKARQFFHKAVKESASCSLAHLLARARLRELESASRK